MTNSWFEVDKEGLAKLLEKRGKSFAIFELIQNAWDQKVTRVDVKLEPLPGSPYAELSVEDDDPHGFSDLAHAFTLFAESEKKSDPTKRGRFNLGEKLVLALCEEATISSTTGTILFTKNGQRLKNASARRERGSKFSGLIRMTRAEYREACEEVMRLIPPSIDTYFNGKLLEERPAMKVVIATLPTEISDAEGFLRKTERKTAIHIYEPKPGEVPSLYELGIPVVETGDKYHVEILQKIPLNTDRDNVTPAFLRKVRTEVLNATFATLSQEDAKSAWVRDAIAGGDATQYAVEHVMEQRFGDKRVAYDPTDPEANNIATARGYTVVHGGSMSGEEWAAVKWHEAILPAGQVTPSPKPFSPDGSPLKFLDPEKYTEGIRAARGFVTVLAQRLLNKHIEVSFANDMGWPFAAVYGKNTGIIFNVARLGKAFFDDAASNPKFIALVLHEFAHEYASNHLSEEYHEALCDLGARLFLSR